jgi:hypothetical protein
MSVLKLKLFRGEKKNHEIKSWNEIPTPDLQLQLAEQLFIVVFILRSAEWQRTFFLSVQKC